MHERGVVVFDTGLHDRLMATTEDLGGLARVFTVELSADDLVEARLAANGIDADAVTHVVNSHLHFDHCGRNGPFAHATTLLQADEWEAAHHRGPTTYVGVHLDEIEAGHVELIDGPHDVFGDGTVVCVPTPGHTAGHQSLLVRAADEVDAAALLVGDACYLQHMLTDEVLPPFGHDHDRQRQTYAELRRHQADGVRLVFSHDVDHWDDVPDALRPPGDEGGIRS